MIGKEMCRYKKWPEKEKVVVRKVRRDKAIMA
jgi:hypothetical protein